MKVAVIGGRAVGDDRALDHLVALSDAWQKGAQQLTLKQRTNFANDPLNLWAVDGGDATDESRSDQASGCRIEVGERHVSSPLRNGSARGHSKST